MNIITIKISVGIKNQTLFLYPGSVLALLRGINLQHIPGFLIMKTKFDKDCAKLLWEILNTPHAELFQKVLNHDKEFKKELVCEIETFKKLI